MLILQLLGINIMNCDDNDCKYLHTGYNTDKHVCDIIGIGLEDAPQECPHFEPRQCCDDCMYATTRVLETGTLDEVDYYCELQDHKLIYQDLSFDCYDKNWPSCNIDKFKRRTKYYNW